MTDRPADNSEELDALLAGLAPDRRTFVKQLATASAFAVPLTLAASLDGSPIREAQAQAASSSAGGGGFSASASASSFAIPTPATLALMGSGVAVLAYLRKRGLDKKAQRETDGD